MKSESFQEDLIYPRIGFDTFLNTADDDPGEPFKEFIFTLSHWKGFGTPIGKCKSIELVRCFYFRKNKKSNRDK